MSSMEAQLYQLPANTPFIRLDASKSWPGLTAKERHYAHSMAKASFHGALAAFVQSSPESPLIFALFQRLFSTQAPSVLAKVAKEVGLTEDEYEALLIYAGGFFENGGNYKGFGDTKIVPALAVEKLEVLLKASAAWSEIADLWAAVKGPMFTLDEAVLRFGFAKAERPGVTTYHSANIGKAEAEAAERFMIAEGMEAWNTRLFKTTTPEGKAEYEIRLASVEVGELRPAKEFEGSLYRVTRGDYSPLMRRCVAHLSQAKAYAANADEETMLQAYIEHFTTGDLDKHKEANRAWIRNKAPPVETYIGFVENYRDPAGTRAEFEGFVAAVDKDTSAKFARLVEKAEQLQERLPWPPAYEKDVFLRPDFTSLDVIAFGSSATPSGIQIPNYDEIRQNEGFKNVSLGNVISATPKQPQAFLSPADDEAYRQWQSRSFEVQVGLHELLGHGSGKLFMEAKDGSLNFDKATVKDLASGEPITSWYKGGETWSSKFGTISSAYEECRAEAVGFVLCCDADILEIFGFTGADAKAIKYVNWLSGIFKGLIGLEKYSPESKAWGQAHCYARFVLLRVLLEAGEGFVSVKETVGEDGQADLRFALDEAKIDSVGRPVIADFLRKLQLYKATGDAARGRQLFERYGTPDEEVLRWRRIVLARRQPRRVFVQANTAVTADGADVGLINYEESPAGCVDSYTRQRYETGVVEEMISIAQADAHHFVKA